MRLDFSIQRSAFSRTAQNISAIREASPRRVACLSVIVCVSPCVSIENKGEEMALKKIFLEVFTEGDQ